MSWEQPDFFLVNFLLLQWSPPVLLARFYQVRVRELSLNCGEIQKSPRANSKLLSRHSQNLDKEELWQLLDKIQDFLSWKRTQHDQSWVNLHVHHRSGWEIQRDFSSSPCKTCHQVQPEVTLSLQKMSDWLLVCCEYSEIREEEVCKTSGKSETITSTVVFSLVSNWLK